MITDPVGFLRPERWPSLILLAALAVSRLAAVAAEVSAGPALVAEGPALLREWVPPVYPPEALKARRSGMVTVWIVVDETGRPSNVRALEESDDEFVAAAVAAVNDWRFAPAIEEGAPVACCLETLVTFSPAVGQQKAAPKKLPPKEQTFQLAPRTAPRPLATPGGEFPEVLVERRLNGVVRCVCVVGKDGRVRHSQVRAASHVDFVLPALAALQQWEFEPGRQGDLAMDAAVEASITFDSIVSSPEEVLAANGITAPDGAPPTVTPMPLTAPEAVWPAERLLAGEAGEASVEFTVRESGSVAQVTVIEATHPEFGHALAAAMEVWHFERPMQGGQGVPVTLRRRVAFTPPADGPLARIAEAVRAGALSGAKGLDGKLTPLYRVAPAYSHRAKAAGAVGSAEIEFVVDRDGRVRLPRIVSATREEFGWAAATAVAQWVFRAPRRGGEPVEVKVRIPFEFKPPAE